MGNCNYLIIFSLYFQSALFQSTLNCLSLPFVLSISISGGIAASVSNSSVSQVTPLAARDTEAATAARVYSSESRYINYSRSRHSKTVLLRHTYNRSNAANTGKTASSNLYARVHIPPPFQTWISHPLKQQKYQEQLPLPQQEKYLAPVQTRQQKDGGPARHKQIINSSYFEKTRRLNLISRFVSPKSKNNPSVYGNRQSENTPVNDADDTDILTAEPKSYLEKRTSLVYETNNLNKPSHAPHYLLQLHVYPVPYLPQYYPDGRQTEKEKNVKSLVSQNKNGKLNGRHQIRQRRSLLIRRSISSTSNSNHYINKNNLRYFVAESYNYKSLQNRLNYTHYSTKSPAQSCNAHRTIYTRSPNEPIRVWQQFTALYPLEENVPYKMTYYGPEKFRPLPEFMDNRPRPAAETDTSS